jgi:hypothetical protein
MASFKVIQGPTIAAGSAVSDVVLLDGQLVRITMPAAWSSDPEKGGAAPLTVQSSPDGLSFNDLFFPDGQEVKITVLAPSVAIAVHELWGRSISYMRLRSGTRERPIIQPQARSFVLTLLMGQPV